MPIQHAKNLLRDIEGNKALRLDLYNCESFDALVECLSSKGYWFTFDEFEDAVNMLHVECQTEEQANDVMNKADWYRGLVYSLRV